MELGLQVIYRSGPTVPSSDDYADDELHFTVSDGIDGQRLKRRTSSNRAGGKFESRYAETGLDGETTDLGDFTFNLKIDFDPTVGTSYRTLVLEPGGPAGAVDRWRDVGTERGVIADDDGTANVTQNSRTTRSRSSRTS